MGSEAFASVTTQIIFFLSPAFLHYSLQKKKKKSIFVFTVITLFFLNDPYFYPVERGVCLKNCMTSSHDQREMPDLKKQYF